MEDVLGVIGVPALETISTAVFKSYVGLEKPAGVVLYCTESIPTHMARNQIVASTLAHPNAKWLFFMDSDMLFPAKTLKQLLSRNLPIVGGAYFQRVYPYNLVSYNYLGVDDKGLYQYLHATADWIDYAQANKSNIPITNNFTGTIINQKGLVETDAIGTGCLLIRREVLEAINHPHFSYDEEGSEDLFFCRKAKAAGFKIYLDMGIVCGHVTRQIVGPAQCLSANGLLRDKSTQEV